MQLIGESEVFSRRLCLPYSSHKSENQRQLVPHRRKMPTLFSELRNVASFTKKVNSENETLAVQWETYISSYEAESLILSGNFEKKYLKGVPFPNY